jgi:hypothetical protein
VHKAKTSSLKNAGKMKINCYAMRAQRFNEHKGFHQIMLKKLTDTVSCSLIAMLAILFVAVGIPLVHPILHDHLGHHHIGARHDRECFQATRHQGRTSECPFCDFLATNQLQSADSGGTIAEGEPVGFIMSANHIILVKSYPLLAEPRAPPAFSFL